MRRPLEQARRWTTRVWETTQVELHGHYSTEQLQRFEQYRATTSWGRALLVCVLTPFPCMLVIVLLDLTPLEAISKGTWGSPRVWIRQYVTVVFISLCMLEQVAAHLPQLELNPPLLVLISLLVSLAGVGTTFALSTVVGYPFPFTMVVGTIPWFVVLSVVIFVFRHRELQKAPGMTTKMGRYLLVMTCQVLITVIYPSYNFLYERASSVHQTALVLVLPVLKIAGRNWISRALPDEDDAKPETVVFNIEIFHSLFVALCMGNTTSIRTIAAIMVVDFIQALLSFADVRAVLKELQPVAAKLDEARRRTDSAVSSSRQSLQYLVSIASRIIEYEPFQAQPGGRQFVRKSRLGTPRKWSSSTASATWQLVKSFTSRRSIRPAFVDQPVLAAITSTATGTGPTMTGIVKLAQSSVARIVPFQLEPTNLPPQRLADDLVSLTAVERGVLVRHTQRLLYMTEFLVLVEYTEVIMPFIYHTMVLAMFHLPNRSYYTFLEGICTPAGLAKMLQSVALYGSLEFLSLLVMATVIWWMIRLSLVHQLAFVLQHRTLNIQAKLLMWVVHALQSSVVQLGPDYSFRFAWLNHTPGQAASPLDPSEAWCRQTSR